MRRLRNGFEVYLIYEISVVKLYCFRGRCSLEIMGNIYVLIYIYMYVFIYIFRFGVEVWVGF